MGAPATPFQAGDSGSFQACETIVRIHGRTRAEAELVSADKARQDRRTRPAEGIGRLEALESARWQAIAVADGPDGSACLKLRRFAPDELSDTPTGRDGLRLGAEQLQEIGGEDR